MYLVYFVTIMVIACFVSYAYADSFECGYDSESPPLILYDIPDTVTGVAIYCCWEEADSDTLPEWAQKIAWFMPLYHAVNITRGLASGNISGLWLDFVWLTAFGSLFYALALGRMRRRLLK